MSEEIKVNKRKIMVSHSDEPVEAMPEEEKPSSSTTSLKAKVIQPLTDSSTSESEKSDTVNPARTEDKSNQPVAPSTPSQTAPKATLGNIADVNPVEASKLDKVTIEDIAKENNQPADDTAQQAPEPIAPPAVVTEPSDSAEDSSESKLPATVPDNPGEQQEAVPAAEGMPDNPELTSSPLLPGSQSQPAPPAPAIYHTKTKKVIQAKKYKVQVGRKGKKSKQAAQRKNSSKKGWKVFLMILSTLAIIGAIWAYAFYLLPRQAASGYMKRLSKADSYSYELDAALVTPGTEGSSVHIEGKIDQSSGSTSSETEIEQDAKKTTYHYSEGQHSKVTNQETTSTKSDETVGVFGNKCGANEVVMLKHIVASAAREADLENAMEADPMLISRHDARLGLSYYGEVEPSQGGELFDTITAEFVATCGSDFMPEQHSRLARLFRNAPIQVELNRGWGSDYLKLTAEHGDTRLVLDLTTYDYNDTEVPTVLTVTSEEPEEPTEEVCDAACRDQERQADLDELDKLLVRYYGSGPNSRGYFPLPGDFVAANFPDADPEIFEDPAAKAINEGGETGYTYQVLPADCDNVSVKCTEYSLVTKLEVTAEAYRYPKAESEEEN